MENLKIKNINVKDIGIVFTGRVSDSNKFNFGGVDESKWDIGIIIDGVFCTIDDRNDLCAQYRVLEKNEKTGEFDTSNVKPNEYCATGAIRFWENSTSIVSINNAKNIITVARQKIEKSGGYNKKDFLYDPTYPELKRALKIIKRTGIILAQ